MNKKLNRILKVNVHKLHIWQLTEFIIALQTSLCQILYNKKMFKKWTRNWIEFWRWMSTNSIFDQWHWKTETASAALQAIWWFISIQYVF